jgi:hypothetical protein
MTTYLCECGEWTGRRCDWTGPLSDMVVVEYMPECLRASCEAARNSGIHPHNGSARVAVCRECADDLLECEGSPDDWPDGCCWAEITDRDPAAYACECESADADA